MIIYARGIFPNKILCNQYLCNKDQLKCLMFEIEKEKGRQFQNISIGTGFLYQMTDRQIMTVNVK